MVLRKAVSFLIVFITSMAMTGCSVNGVLPNADSLVQRAIENDRDALPVPIVHEVYKYGRSTDVKVLSIYNTLGDICIKQSVDDQMHVIVNLVQTKALRDIDTKLDNLQIVPQTKNQILFFEPLAKDGTTNYWEWIEKNLNANGIKVDFEVQMPSRIQEVRLFDELGNISLNGVKARVYAQTDLGSITGQNIIPLDTAVLKVNSPFGGDDLGIDISFSSLEFANEISAGVSNYNMMLTVPPGIQFTHKMDYNMVVKYNKPMYSRFDYCRSRCLAKFHSIKQKQGETVIKTTAENKFKTVTID